MDELNDNPFFQGMKNLEKLNVNGTDEDIIPEGYGEFGHEETNPIPVNTIMGTSAYLGKLRTIDGIKVTYERVGSTSASNIKGMIDEYEIFANGERVARLFISPYNKKNSGKEPKGFVLSNNAWD